MNHTIINDTSIIFPVWLRRFSENSERWLRLRLVQSRQMIDDSFAPALFLLI